jgi:hypothetical protein
MPRRVANCEAAMRKAAAEVKPEITGSATRFTKKPDGEERERKERDGAISCCCHKFGIWYLTFGIWLTCIKDTEDHLPQASKEREH